jgi:hypothetical protein
MKKILFLLLALNLWSCNDCSKVLCSSGEFINPAFTIRDKATNLLLLKSIDIKTIEAFDIDLPTPKPLRVDVFDVQKDTLFRIVLTSNNNKIRIKWPQDSIDLEVQYKIVESECCSDQTTLKQINYNNNALKTSGGIVVIKR